MNKHKLIAVAGAIGALSALSFAQYPVQTPAPKPDAVAPVSEVTSSLKRVVKVGDISKYKLKAELEFGGQQVGYTSNMKEEVVEVSKEGNYEIESSQSDSKINMNGQDQDVPAHGSPNKITYSPDGLVLEIKGSTVEAGAYRMANLGLMKTPDAPVKVNDAWTYKISANKSGAVAATADYKVLSAEKIGDHDTLKISIKVKETEGSEPASNEGMMWIDAKDGSMVKSDTSWTNAPIPGAPGPINGKVVVTRI